MIPGAFTLATYSFVLVMGSGSLVMCYLAAAFFTKVAPLMCHLFCPTIEVAVKKKHHKIPRDFSNYASEFNFDCEDGEPVCWEQQQEVTRQEAN